MSNALFPLGRIVGTPGALDALQEAGQNPMTFLRRHATGDCGDLDADDKAENELSVKEGFRILSTYTTSKGVKLWCITEHDRSYTTILSPSEY